MRNNQQFFEKLVKAYSTDLFRFGFWLAKDRNVAEDLVQETFTRAWRAIDSLNDEKAAKAWLSNLSMVAASFLIVVVGFWVWQTNDSPLTNNLDSQVAVISPQEMSSRMVDHILEHTVDQVHAMPASQLAVDDVDLQRVFAFVGASLHKSIDRMSYAGQCDVDGKLGLHIVIQEKTGPVTVIVMPGEHLAVIKSFEQSGYVGNLIPVKGAVVAIIGKTEEEVAMAQMHFFQSVDFG